MSNLPFATLTIEQFVDHILDRVNDGPANAGPAYSLVLGSGFSSPLFPTAGTMVERDIAWWKFGRSKNLQFTDAVADAHADDLAAYSKTMWQKVLVSCGDTSTFKLNPETGLPFMDSSEATTNAYQSIMSGRSNGGLNTPELRRNYFRALCDRVGKRINLAHLSLGSLLHEQSTPEWKREGRRPFCRTILTTNFDPLLQRALQLHNVLYFMSDQPLGGITAPDDEDQAVHLVYTHGSVHRRHLANNPDDIARLKESNAAPLASYLAQQGVIVLGYSGWNDTTFTALQACKEFQGNLYWCGREPGEIAATCSLSHEVRRLLAENRNGRFYVALGSGGADDLMHRVHRRLVGLVPSIVGRPTDLLVRELESIQWPKTGLELFDGIEGIARRQIERLKEFDLGEFISREGEKVPTDVGGPAISPESKPWTELFALADQAALAADFRTTIWHLTSIIERGDVPEHRRAFATVYRGYAKGKLIPPELDGAIKDFSDVIDLPGSPAEDKATALIQRGLAKGLLDPPDRDGQIADYSQVLAMPDAPAVQKAISLINRGIAKGLLNPPDWHAEIADCTQVVGMPDAPLDEKAHALINRGIAKGQLDPPDQDGQIADFSQVISMPEAPAQQKAMALINRGIARGLHDPPDREGEIADFTLVVTMPDASAEAKARALTNRGIAKGLLDPPDRKGQIDDFGLVLTILDAPAKEKAKALINLGIAKGLLDPPDRQGEIADYNQVLTMPDAPPLQKAKALFNRGIAKGMLDPPDTVGAIADFSQVLTMPDVSIEQCAMAMVNRGVAKGQLDPPDREGQIADYSQVLAMPESVAGQKTKALINRGIARSLLDPPDRDNANADYREALNYSVASLDQRAQASFNLACSAGLVGSVGESIFWLSEWSKFASHPTQGDLDGDSDFDRIRNDPESAPKRFCQAVRSPSFRNRRKFSSRLRWQQTLRSAENMSVGARSELNLSPGFQRALLPQRFRQAGHSAILVA